MTDNIEKLKKEEARLDSKFMALRNLYIYTKDEKQEKEIINLIYIIFSKLYPIRVKLQIYLKKGKSDIYFKQVLFLIKQDKERFSKVLKQEELESNIYE